MGNIQQGETELFIFSIMMHEIIHEKVSAKILSHRNAGRARALPGMRICSSGPCYGGRLIEATNNTLDAELKNIGGSRPKEYGIEYLSQVSVAGIILGCGCIWIQTREMRCRQSAKGGMLEGAVHFKN